MTEMRFEHSHLAQLKYILPEVIEIKKILVRDDRTSCMKPDLHVALNFSKFAEKLSESNRLEMRRLFRSRLVYLSESSHEEHDIPQAELPEPFNQSIRSTLSNGMKKLNLGSFKDTTYSNSELQPVVASHMPQSFKRRFSKQVATHNVKTVEPTKVACVSNVPSPVITCSTRLPETPTKRFDLEKMEDLSLMDIGTPAKLALSPHSVRGFMTKDEDSMMSSSKLEPSKKTRRLSSRRSLTFDTPVERVSTNDDELYDLLPQDVVASINKKELKALEEKNSAILQAKCRKRMIAGLPKLFNMLLFFFQSSKRSVVIKEELIQMIISNHLKITDRREADEQLRLLQELAPEWMYEKTASTGDLLLCINKISSPESIRTRLSEAN